MSKQTVEWFVVFCQLAIFLAVALMFFRAIAGDDFLDWMREFSQTHSFPFGL